MDLLLCCTAAAARRPLSPTANATQLQGALECPNSLSQYMNMCVSHRYHTPLWRDGFREWIPLAISRVHQELPSHLGGKRVHFLNAQRAGIATVRTYNDAQLCRIERFADSLTDTIDLGQLDVNQVAIDIFMEGLRKYNYSGAFKKNGK